MSFVSTYNSLSIRDWQAQGDQPLFWYRAQLPVSDFRRVEATNSGQYIICSEDPPGVTYSLFERFNNNTLGGVSTVTCISNSLAFVPLAADISRTTTTQTNTKIIVSNDSFDTNIPNRVNIGVVQVREFGNANIIFTIVGNSNNQRFGTAVASNGTSGTIAIHNGCTLPGQSPNIQIYTNSSGNYILRDTINVTSRQLNSIDLDDSGNTLVYGDPFGNGNLFVYEYNGNTWSNTQLIPSSNTANFGYNPKINGSGNIIITYEFSNYTPNMRGRLHIFGKSGNTWSETAIIDPANVNPGNLQVNMNRDASISEDGNLVLCSLSDYSNNLATIQPPFGLQIYQKESNTYNLIQTIGNANTENNFFGLQNFLSNTGKVIITTGRTANFPNITGNVTLFISGS